MNWLIAGLAVTAVGLAVRMYFLGRSLGKAEALVAEQTARADQFAEAFDTLKKRSEGRIEQLKDRNKELFDEFMLASGDDDRRAFLNRLLADEDSEGSGSGGDVSGDGEA